MSHWNYRVMKSYVSGETYYAIHEVYYDDAGEPHSWTEDAIDPVGDTLDELRNELLHMLVALERDVFEVPSE